MIALEYRSVPLPDFNPSEILRYAKTKQADGLPLAECMEELKGLEGSVVFAEFDVTRQGNRLDLGFAVTESADLAKALGQSKKILVFAATVGMLPDQLIAKYSHVSPTKAVLLQAIATERIEALCDAFCEERKRYYGERGLVMKPRFSPGYGDLSIDLQQDIMTALDCHKKLGIFLTESLLMMPSKSVTAIVGIDGR